MKKFLFILLPCIITGKVFSYPDQYEVLKDQINVREDSTTIAASLGYLNNGDVVTVVDEKYEWYKIILPQNFSYPYFVSAEFIKTIAETKGEVTASYLNIRSNPSLNSPVIGKIEKGKIVSLIEKKDNWYTIEGYPYVKGWVHKKFLKKVDYPSQPADLTKKGETATSLTSQTSEIGNSEENIKDTPTIPVTSETDTKTLPQRYELQSPEIPPAKKISLWELPPEELSMEQIISLLNSPDMIKKKKIHEYLIGMGPKVISQLESYLPDADINTTYSIILVLGHIGRNYPVLTLYFLTKVDSSNPLLTGIYLDITQDIIQPMNSIEGYFYLAKENKLFPQDIEKAKRTLHKLYTEQSKNLKVIN